MVQLKIASENQPDSVHHLQRFPVIFGRSGSAHLRFEEPGVWEQHLRLDLEPGEGFILAAFPGTWALVNGRKTDRARLKNGDLIEMGSVKIGFYLSDTRQRSLRARETLTWLAVALLCAAQIALIYHLLR